MSTVLSHLSGGEKKRQIRLCELHASPQKTAEDRCNWGGTYSYVRVNRP